MAVDGVVEGVRRIFKRLAQYRRSRQTWKTRPRLAYLVGGGADRLKAETAARWPGGYVRLADGHYMYVPTPLDGHGRGLLCEPFVVDPLIDLLVRPGDTAIDIGANHGEWSLPLARRVGTAGQLHAFEPIPALARALAKSFRVNGYPWAKVHSSPLAATPGPVRFVIAIGAGTADDSGQSHIARPNEASAGAMTLEAGTLDRFAASLTRLDFLKIDVEGFEEEVLKGAAETLRRLSPRLVVETGHEDAAGRARIAALLDQGGYDLIGVALDGGIVEIDWTKFADPSGPLPLGTVANLVILPRT